MYIPLPHSWQGKSNLYDIYKIHSVQICVTPSNQLARLDVKQHTFAVANEYSSTIYKIIRAVVNVDTCIIEHGVVVIYSKIFIAMFAIDV